MARFSQMKTPKRAAAWEEDEEESVNEDRSSPGASNTEGANNSGLIEHLNSGLPDIPARPEDSEGSTNRRDTEALDRSLLSLNATPMGANNSREEINAAIRATSSELQQRNNKFTTANGNGNGRLKRVSTGAPNPPYRNPAVPPQRKFTAKSNIRPDTYDLDESPEKLRIQPKKRQAKEVLAFSPLKRQRGAAHVVPERAAGGFVNPFAKDQQAADAQLLQEQGLMSSPRRSRRVQGEEVEQAGAGAQGGTQDAQLKDWFSDRVAQRAAEKADHGAGIAGNAVLEAADKMDDAARQEEEQQQPASSPAKRALSGRFVRTEVVNIERPMKSPQKHKVAEELANIDDPQEPSATTSRKQGRPKGSLGKRNKRSSIRAQQAINDKATDTEPGADVQRSPYQERRTSPRKRKRAAVTDLEEEKEKIAAAEPTVNPNEGLFMSEAADEPAQPKAKKKLKPKQRQAAAVVVRPSELGFGDALDEEGDGLDKQDQAGGAEEEDIGAVQDEHDEESEERPPEKKQRPQASQRSKKSKTGRSSQSKANTSRKRSQPSRPEPELESEDEFDAADAQRFYGQWPQLKEAFKGANAIRDDLEGDARMKRIVKTIDLCNTVAKDLQKLRAGEADAEDPASDLISIGQRIDVLCNNNKVDFNDENLSTDIFAHLIPRLTILLRQLLECYEEMDSDRPRTRPLAVGHLKIITTYIALVLKLEHVADKQYVNPDSSLAVKKPVHSIMVKLRGVHKVFDNILQRHYASVRAARLEARQRAEEANAATREEEEARQRAEERKLIDKWNALHVERRYAETANANIMSRKKSDHLACPDYMEPELDQNGHPFIREAAFRVRIGPTPDMIDAANANTWSIPELEALEDGLKMYAGEHVFRSIIRRHCLRRGLLNRFNVTEIVTAAANLKEYYTDKFGEGAEDWVRLIPEWTKPGAIGKENEDQWREAETLDA